MAQAPRRSGRCTRRPSTTTNCSSEEKSQESTSRWLLSTSRVQQDQNIKTRWLVSWSPQIKLAKNMMVGSDFEVFAVLTNNYVDTRRCSFTLFARSVNYNGRRGESCGFASDKVELASGEGRSAEFIIPQTQEHYIWPQQFSCNLLLLLFHTKNEWKQHYI